MIARTRRIATALAFAAVASSTTLSQTQFARLCGAAMRCRRPLELKNRTVILDAPHKVGAGDALAIRGPGAVVGSGHSVFQVGGSARPFGLRVSGVRLRHVASGDRAEQRALGACVFARGKGAVALERCAISSEAGFGVWLAPVWKSNLQPDFNVRLCDSFDASSSAVLRELDESNRFVQKSAESTSI